MAASTALFAGQVLPMRVIAFDGGWNLPIWAAQRQGSFAAHGVAVALVAAGEAFDVLTRWLTRRYLPWHRRR